MHREYLPAILLIVASLSSGCGGEPPAGTGLDEAVGTWVEMWNSYDLSEVDELFLPDSSLTYFSSEKEGIIRGIEAVREHHRGFGFVEGGMVQGNRLWLEEVESDAFGSVFVVTGIWFFSRSGDEAEAAEPQRGPVTFVYLFRDGRYLLAHLNFAEYKESEEPGSD